MGEQLEELERELQAQGHTVSFREPIEERGLPTAGPGFQVALYLGELLEDHVLDAIIGALLTKLLSTLNLPGRARRARRPTVAIFGPSGRLLRKVELQEEDEGE